MLPGVLPMAVTQEPVGAAGGAPEAEAVAASVVGPDTSWQAVTCGSAIPYESSIATAAECTSLSGGVRPVGQVDSLHLLLSL